MLSPRRAAGCPCSPARSHRPDPTNTAPAGCSNQSRSPESSSLPGDIVVADADGVVVVQRAEAERVLADAERVEAKETAKRLSIEETVSPGSDLRCRCLRGCLQIWLEAAPFSVSALNPSGSRNRRQPDRLLLRLADSLSTDPIRRAALLRTFQMPESREAAPAYVLRGALLTRRRPCRGLRRGGDWRPDRLRGTRQRLRSRAVPGRRSSRCRPAAHCCPGLSTSTAMALPAADSRRATTTPAGRRWTSCTATGPPHCWPASSRPPAMNCCGHSASSRRWPPRDSSPGSIPKARSSPHARCGAQNPRWLRDPDPELLRHMLEAAGGALKTMTYAPELPGAGELVRMLTEHGVTPSLGHTDADARTTAASLADAADLIAQRSRDFRAARPANSDPLVQRHAAAAPPEPRAGRGLPAAGGRRVRRRRTHRRRGPPRPGDGPDGL